MFTQCPKCGSYFRVRDEELHAADGHVRCSLCTNTFNALSHLEPELPSEDDHSPVELDKPDTEENVELTVEEHDDSPQAISKDPLTWDMFEETPVGASPASEDPQPTADDAGQAEVLDAPSPEPTTEKVAPAGPSDPIQPATEKASQEMDRQPSKELVGLSPFDIPDPSDDRAEGIFTFSGKESPLWALGSVVLLLLLGVQFIHMERLYWSQHETLGGIVAGTYQRLTGQVPQERDLETLRVVRTDMAGTDSDSGHLRVTSVVENHGDKDQPLPAVYVRLEDRWGLNMGHGFFEPEEWIYRETLPDHFSARSRLPLRLELSDPGRDAVSFHIELCWPENGDYACYPRRGGAAYTR